MSDNAPSAPTPSASGPQRRVPASAGARKTASKSSRSRAREFVLQALYQHLVGRNSAEAIDAFTRDLSGFHKADAAHYNTVLHGCIETGAYMDALITPLLDRKMEEISPVEHAAMWMGVFEFQHCPDVPWRVVLNECIELTKDFGGTDGHKYVNAVLGGLAPQLRATEVAADKGRPGVPSASSRAAPPPASDTGEADALDTPAA
ncbi:transcription antitermination factor NusB [Simplicispira psychrophila]|uniref:transcription antitermination factor NusB n=1 Tax=Simplicispira psychrophila TaxID=80882 RepID=UPI000691F878|nr:transcription antitermination factor NusB [Simplicispira psychrophila]